MDKKYAEIALINQSRHTDQVYTYKIPEKIQSDIKLGSRVMVPFGNGNKIFEAFVLGFSVEPTYKTKEILAMPDQSIALSENQLALCKWMVSYCYATISETLQLLVPTGATFKREKYAQLNMEKQNEWPLLDPLILKLLKEPLYMDTATEEEKKQLKIFFRKNWITEKIEFTVSVKTVFEKRVRILFDPHEVEKKLIYIPKSSKKQREILSFLALKEDVSYRTLSVALKASKSSIIKLVEEGLIETYEIEKYREPVQLQLDERDDFKALNPEQQVVYDALMKDFIQHNAKTHLLHGITGSGKTEIYMHLIKHIVDSGKQVILLVPEISLTPQIVKRFVSRFGKRVAILHSKLSLGERYDQWKRIKNGEYPIIIGARSAIFAPVDNLGLIIIDEEHESAYKSDQSPQYYTHDVAEFLSKQYECPMLLGSATPSVESYYKSLKKTYQLHELHCRFNHQPLPLVDIVDMREELQLGNKSILSERLIHALSETLENGKQVILFLNRRGFSTFISCRECGYSLKCPNCEIALTYYKGKNYAECKYCGYSVKVTTECPECQSKYYRYFGSGTEKIEEEMRIMFPKASIGRLDSDTTSKKGTLEEILKSFENKETDVLIGTQMIAKGLDYPNVGLVGVLSADVLLNLPDYKASERAFQLLTQVAGRTGRGDELGKVIFQTYEPDHYSILCAQKHDFLEFFKNEIQLRRSFFYPPYIEMVSLVLSSEKEDCVIKYSEKLYNRIGSKMKLLGVKFQAYGPSPAMYHRLKSRYRYQIMIKYERQDIDAVKELINSECKELHKETSRVDLVLSVDHKPINI